MTRSTLARHQRDTALSLPDIAARVASLDWPALAAALDAHGCATTGTILTADECSALRDVYGAEEPFRSRIVMARHGFGRGEYKYSATPCPRSWPRCEPPSTSRSQISPIAGTKRWGLPCAIPPSMRPTWRAATRRARRKPTPLLLQYGAGDYNCLHQDVYGEHVFPLQAAFLLSRPRDDFAGGEFVLTEQRPRMQSRAEVVSLQRGEAVIFPVRHRPAQGARGVYRVNMRHGVSRLRSGSRHTLGVIFHDGK